MADCARCGVPNVDVARFCMACGASLGAPEVMAAESRRTVSIVFADMVGSTSIGDDLDPEAVRAIQDGFFTTLTEVIERHGGTVEKYIGDAVVAVFGVPELHEDDALRAVRAAQAIRLAMNGLNDWLATRGVAAIQIRIGVNTGEVSVRNAGDRQGIVAGDAINVTARLEQAAAPGEILVGPVTYELVRDAIVADPRRPIAAKGKRERLRAWRLRDIRPEGEAVVRRLDTPLVGRDRELQVLLDAFDRAVRNAAPTAVVVVGPAGIGKSRLLHEFVGRIRGTSTVLRARSPESALGLWPLVELLRTAADIPANASEQTGRDRIAALTTRAPDGPLLAARIGTLAGLDSDPIPAEDAAWAVRSVVEQLSHLRPVALVIDDIQWADPGLLDVVADVLDRATGPVLIILMARPEIAARRIEWLNQPGATLLRLGSLPGDDADRLVANLLAGSALPPEIGPTVREAADGNPLFLEQLVARLVDRRLIERVDGRLVATKPISTIDVPPSIGALLGARVDSLTAPEVSTLERAAVLGITFSIDGLRSITPAAGQPAIADGLDGLVRRELLLNDDRAEPGGGYRFAHALLREAAYGRLPKRVRAELHVGVSDWLLARAGDRADGSAVLLADHLERAHRYLREIGSPLADTREVAERAAHWLGVAGMRDFHAFDMPNAAARLGRAVELTNGTASSAHLLPRLAYALVFSGELASARSTLDRAAAMPSVRDDPALAGRCEVVRLHLFHHYEPTDWPARTLTTVGQLLPGLRSSGDAGAVGEALFIRSVAEGEVGDDVAAERTLKEALAWARKAGDRQLEVHCLTNSVVDALNGPTPVPDAIGFCQRTLSDADLGLLRAAEVQGTLAILLAMADRPDEGVAESDRAWQTVLDVGSPQDVVHASMPGCLARYWAGDFSGAAERIGEGELVAAQIGDQGTLRYLLVRHAQVLIEDGRIDEAGELVDRWARMPDDGFLAAQAFGLAAKARVAAHRQQARVARQALQELHPFFERLGSNGKTIVLLDAGDAYRRLGEPEPASRLEQRAHELAQRKGNVVAARRAEARLLVVS